MPTERDQEEQDLRIDQMAINVEKIRFDIQESRDKLQRDIEESREKTERDEQRWQRTQKWETLRFVVSAIVAGAALAGAGAAIGNWIGRQQAAQTMFPPGTVITIPPQKPL